MKKRKIVYIAHPIGGDVTRNLAKIENLFTRLMNEKEVIPFAPYIQGFKHLDDSIPEDRKLGIANNKAFFKNKSFHEIWLYGETISKGMWQEIEWAKQNGIKVVPKTIGTHDAFDVVVYKEPVEFTKDEYNLLFNALEYRIGKLVDKLMDTNYETELNDRIKKYSDLRTKIMER